MNRTIDRVLLARHVALSAGAVAAYLFQFELQTGYLALWIVGVSATLNFLAYLFQARPSMASFSRQASPIIGLGSWTALAAVTNGAYSPFIAGLWLEIVLSAVALRLRGVVAVTLTALAGIVAAQAWVGFEGAWVRLGLQLGFTGAMGTLTFFLARRWLRAQERLDAQRSELDERLAELNQRLEDERVVAELGENVARLAHGLKNAVHSLRGFVRLIEPKVQGQKGVGPAMQGLRRAIDDLESLAHLTLGSAPSRSAPAESPPPRRRRASTRAGVEEIGSVVRAAVENVSAGHDSFDVEVALAAQLPPTPLASKSLEEVLIILLRNAAEAMQGRGRASIAGEPRDGGLLLMVRDTGPGFGGVDVAEIFKPGYTTKEGGSGYGLFLARRILEEHGGRLSLETGAQGGAVVTLWLPAADERSED
jgi:signal transduction histidine kinase